MSGTTLQKPLRHLTVRVAWQDNGWDGTVCQKPGENTYCLALKRVREERKDDEEARVACRHFSMLSPTSLPPCKAENSYFMSETAFDRIFDHPYRQNKKAQKTHGHLKPAKVQIPAHSAVAVPFWWMNRDSQKEVANRSPATLPPDEKDPFPKQSPWVFARDRQEAILDLFFDQLTPRQSLVFFYTKEGQPIRENLSRLVVGVGSIEDIPGILRYDSTEGKRYPLWDRIIPHSIRRDGHKGFVLPYQEYLKPTGDAAEDQRRRELLMQIVVEAPVEHRRTFSYGSELADPDVALTMLVRCLKAVRLIKQHGIVPGPWSKREDWLNEQIAAAWRSRGAFPGLGAALEALGLRLGTALAWDLNSAGQLTPDDDPWPLIADLFAGEKKPPHKSYAAELKATAGAWAGLTPDEKELLLLLSRFDLTPKQAKRWFDPRKRAYVAQADIAEATILDNPYVIVERDLGDGEEPAVTMGQVDRGLMPDPTIVAKNPVSVRSAVSSPNDPRRLQAALVLVLRNSAQDGDSLLSVREALQRVEKLDLGQTCMITEPWIRGNAQRLKGIIDILDAQVDVNGTTKAIPSIQLTELGAREKDVRQILSGRACKPVPSLGADWRTLLIETIQSANSSFNPADPRHKEALDSQATALERITTRRTSVLVGKAGTGKTSVLGALLRCEALTAGGVLLLAPTGKARVRLGRAARATAQTVAQFLNGCKRYDGKRQRVLFSGGEPYRKERTVVIDECSMLTLDDLAAVLSALDQAHLQRLILVGDPNQLPPIGVGRPFADWVAHLDDCERSGDPKRKGLAQCLGRLYVEVRSQAGAPSDALRLASWYTREPQPVDADRILSDLESGAKLNDLEVAYWKTPEELRQTILAQFRKHLGVDGADDVAGFNKALGFRDEGWMPYENPDGVENFQILSPVRMQPHGVYDINRWLQGMYRRAEIERAHKHWGISLGDEEIVKHDKVIQLENRWVTPYDCRPTEEDEQERPKQEEIALANGEIGVVATEKSGYLNILFAGRPWLTVGYYGWGETRDAPLELAYALTVHKCQGSEFKRVFVVVPKQCRLLSRELLYTALTRSRERLVLLVEGDGPSQLYDYTKPEKSETVRRCTNLFAPVVREEREADPYAQHLIHRASKDLLVRSKSELLIATVLLDMGIVPLYERAYEGKDGRKLRPDFSFITPAGDLIIWEHLGMLGRSDYSEAWKWKRKWYEDNEFVLGENLFTTEDDLQGGLDAGPVRAVAGEIRKRVKGE